MIRAHGTALGDVAQENSLTSARSLYRVTAPCAASINFKKYVMCEHGNSELSDLIHQPNVVVCPTVVFKVCYIHLSHLPTLKDP